MEDDPVIDVSGDDGRSVPWTSSVTAAGQVDRYRNAGVSVVEVLVVVAIVGILAALVIPALRPADAATYARHVARTLGEGRFASIARNANVVVTWDDAAQALVLETAPLNSCTPDVDSSLVLRANLSEFPGASVDATSFSAMAWQPNGLPDFCGSALPSMVVTDRNRTLSLALTVLGEVTIE